MMSSDPAVQPGARSPADSAAEVERLRVELEHRDQLLAAVYARADALQREIELLERQLGAAIEAQREAATERSELRRLLGNAQLQVHALLRIAPPGSEAEGAAEAPQDARIAVEDRPGEPVEARPPETEELAPPPEQPPSEEPHAEEPPTAPEPVPESPSEPPERQRARPTTTEPRGLVDDAREAWSSLRRLF